MAEGIVNISMNGGALNTRKGSSLWANKLIVTGNGNTRWTKKLWYQDADDVFLRHDFTGPETIGQESNPFDTKIAQIGEIDATTGIMGLGNRYVGQDERATYVTMKAIDDIHVTMRHVLIFSSNADGSVRNDISDPKLNVGDIISSGGDVTITFDAPGELVQKYSDRVDVEVSKPGTKNNYVTLDGVTVVQGAEGYKIVDGYLALSETDTYLNLSDYVINTIDDDVYYLLPNGLLLRATKQSNGSLVFRSIESGVDGIDGEFGDVRFVFNELGQLQAITYINSDEIFGERISREINFGDGTVTMNIGSAGGSVYLTRDDQDLVWELPDGTHIYMKNAFIKTEKSQVK